MFRPGFRPWNKDMKGIHLSPSSEFKPGHTGTRRLEVGATTVRSDKQGNDRAWVKVAEPNKWRTRATLVWETANGPIPRGMVIHHHDRNALNDDLDNLRCISKAEHIIEHKSEFEDRRSKAAAEARWGHRP